MNKTWKIVVLVQLACTVALGTMLFTGSGSKAAGKIAYVDVAKVYNDFELKKELESKLTNVQQARKTILDSMAIELNMMSSRLTEKSDMKTQLLFQQKRNEYLTRQQQYEQDNAAAQQEYTSQIWKQLNQYVGDFGKNGSYQLVLGGDGSGAVMYAEDVIDLTDQVKVFVNERYRGKQ